MKYDLSQPISKRGIGEKDAKNQRIAEIADEHRRRSQIYEAESGAGQEHVGRFGAEQCSTESFAKKKDMWIPMGEVFDLGLPDASGNENDIYTREDTVQTKQFRKAPCALLILERDCNTIIASTA